MPETFLYLRVYRKSSDPHKRDADLVHMQDVKIKDFTFGTGESTEGFKVMLECHLAEEDLIMACVCGHSQEEHGHDPEYPGSTACTECSIPRGEECVAYEEADEEGVE